MNESKKSTSSIPDFKERVKDLSKPFHKECLSEESRNVRNYLLLVSSVLLLFTFGLIVFDNKEVQIAGGTFTLLIRIKYVLSFLNLYFLVSFIFRCYPEWVLWQLAQPEQQILDLRKDFRKEFSPYVEKTENERELESRISSNDDIDLIKKIQKKIQKDFLKDFHYEISSYLEVIDGVDGTIPYDKREKNRIRDERRKIFKENPSIYEADRQSSEEENVIKNRLKELNKQDIELTKNLHEQLITQSDLQQLKKQLSYHSKAVKVGNWIRFWWEIAVPILYGAFSIIIGFIMTVNGPGK